MPKHNRYHLSGTGIAAGLYLPTLNRVLYKNKT